MPPHKQESEQIIESSQTNRSIRPTQKGAPVFADLGDRDNGRIVLLVVLDFEKPQLDPEILEEGFSCYPRPLRKEGPVPESVAREVPNMIDGVRLVGEAGP